MMELSNKLKLETLTPSHLVSIYLSSSSSICQSSTYLSIYLYLLFLPFICIYVRIYILNKGHDGWVVGDAPIVGYEFNAVAAKTYGSSEEKVEEKVEEKTEA